MTVLPLAPSSAAAVESDAPLGASASGGEPSDFARALRHAVADAGNALDRAATSEAAFASGHGSLHAMILDRAQADVTLSVASARRRARLKRFRPFSACKFK